MVPREIFPIFLSYPTLCYLDNAATTHKTEVIINALSEGYARYTFPAGKSRYTQAENAYDVVMAVKESIAKLLEVPKHTIALFPSATIIAHSIITTIVNNAKKHSAIALHEESHNCIVATLFSLASSHPLTIFWFSTGEELEEIVKKNGALSMIFFPALSHITGTDFYEEIIPHLPHLTENDPQKTITIVDGCQQMPLFTRPLSPYVSAFFFTAHKMYGPYNIAFCVIREEMKHCFPPVIFGGNIRTMNEGQVVVKTFPSSLEFGSLDIPAAYAFLKTILWVNEHIYRPEYLQQITQLNNEIRNIIESTNATIISHKQSSSITTFIPATLHANDWADLFTKQSNGAVRTGFFCAEQFFSRRNLPAAIRISLGAYNSIIDRDILKEFLEKINFYAAML